MTPTDLLLYLAGAILFTLLAYPFRQRLGCGGRMDGLVLFFMWPLILAALGLTAVWSSWCAWRGVHPVTGRRVR